MSLYREEANSYITYAEIDAEIGSDDAADKPEKFKYASWNKWEESVYIYLDPILSKSSAPLSYVIRKDLDPGCQVGRVGSEDPEHSHCFARRIHV